ncbi:unnamed protein product [Darwinula stevensoni]|uniref:Translocation protein SEC62 n=1 Tax=Darwinula stevensoni TaxID=69355 RepID=A0A7R8XB98_9CRUS|nr:unnamed protein product [Darwinula stevensoni]CAG0891360.1 unnamed protein product [Darwinula stevensoni]
MAERRKQKKKGKEDLPRINPNEKPSKEETAVAKYMMKHVPTKKTRLLHHTVNYFTGSKAVDILMDSPFASDKGKTPPLFNVSFILEHLCFRMLRHKFFHRAKKVPIGMKDLKGKALKKFKEETEKKKKEKEKRDTEAESSQAEGGKNKDSMDDEDSSISKQEKEKKEKKRIKLDMHLEQMFVDGNDAYVWIYDHTPWYYWILSVMVVVGAVALCLFPLWPSAFRQGVYYLSLAAVGFLVVILGLTVLRLVIFCIVWALTFGRHHLWILPNLTEDVGFFASFWPLYKYEYKGLIKDGKKEKRKKKTDGGKEHDSDGDADNESDGERNRKGRRKKKDEMEGEKEKEGGGDGEKETEERKRKGKEAKGEEEGEVDEEEAEDSDNTPTGKDFEMVEKDEDNDDESENGEGEAEASS